MRAAMKPRERVLAALNHQEPDRVPIDFGGMKLGAYRNLLNHLQMGDRPVRVGDLRGQGARIDEDILRLLEVDFRRVSTGGPDRLPSVILPNESGQHEAGSKKAGAAPRERNLLLPGESFRDEWGVVRRRPVGSSGYEITYSPFAEDGTLSALDRFPWPDPDDPGRYRGLRERALKLRNETDHAIVCDLRCNCFIRAAEMRGLENFFMDLIDSREFAGALMDRMLDIKLAIAERALREVGDLVDIVVTADDLGMTTGPLISLNTYRTMVKPRHKRVFDFFKARTAAKRFLHSDGDIHVFIDDLIEIGVEILDPVQVSCPGMSDTRLLKEKYGSRLTFHGGFDMRAVVSAGSTDDVRREVQRRIQDLAPGGGYIVAPVGGFWPEDPPENILAMYNAAKEFGQYPIKAGVMS